MTQRIRELETIGERLRKRREALGFSVEDIAHEIQAPSRYIKAFEEDDYETFPAKVYAQGYLKKLLSTLSFQSRDDLWKEFLGEWEVRTFRKQKELVPLRLRRSGEPYLTPRRLGFLFVSMALIALLAFLSVKLFNFVGPPRLVLEEPDEQEVVDGPLVEIKGDVEEDSQLTVNGREITVDGQGRFDEDLELVGGLNILEFVVKDRFGKENRVVRYVLVK